jgi:hypothetical protein
MPDLLKPLVWLFAALAAIGLALSILSHLAALLGMQGPLGDRTWLLHLGIFAVWIPAIILSHWLTRDFARRDYWKAALRGCPPWMRNKYLMGIFFGYIVLNFVLYMVNAPTKSLSTSTMSPAVVRGFSGHWMAFYAGALAIFYSSLHVNDKDFGRRCLDGHTVGPLALFCERCGKPVVEG